MSITLFRVIAYREGAGQSELGGAFYIPPQGHGRLDNPDLFAVLYTGENQVGCVAEAFGRIHSWTTSLFAGHPTRAPARALATYTADPDRLALCDLDDAHELVRQRMRPSDVITRDYGFTQKWARALFERGRWAGVRWWSYYEARWANVGLWDIRALKVASVEPLTADHPAVVAAAASIGRTENPRSTEPDSQRQARPRQRRRRS